MPSVPVDLACVVRDHSPERANPVCCRYAGQALRSRDWIRLAHPGRARSGGGENTMRIAGRPCTLLSTAALAVAMTVGLAGAAVDSNVHGLPAIRMVFSPPPLRA